MKPVKNLTRMVGILMSVCMLTALSVPAAATIDQAKLVFMLGCVGTTQNVPHTVSLDDVSLCKIN